ncbi:sulfatase-like hydrolase/transferase [Erwinia sp. CPCC 100877]|nr:sulfatase-like hydrolase/transferase [Erwinia sp. CPCC 100877]
MNDASSTTQRKNLHHSIQKRIIIFLLSIVIALIITWSSGYTTKNAYGNTLIILLLLLLARKNHFSAIISSFFLVLCSLYAPIGILYGKINEGFIASALQTDTEETLEFIQLIPANYYFISIGIFSLTVFFWKTSNKKNKNKIALFLFLILLVNSWPKRMATNLLTDTFNTISNIKNYDKLLQKQHDNWQLLPGSHRYHTVVVVIGESVRKDYLSVYGYPLSTTPWLNNTPGIFVDGYLSAAANTITSLSRSLISNYNEKGNIGNNIVSLANKAGYHTWWISNQGNIGQHDTLISVIGHNANHPVFMKNGSFSSLNVDDEKLLPPIYDAIKSPNPKVIFVHMMGSHPNPCTRLFSYPNNYEGKFPSRISCYLATINKTDDFLRRINEFLTQHEQSFAMIYFSDHGMSVDSTKNRVQHDLKLRTSYEVPLIITANDITEHRLIKKPLSARNLLGIFGWLTGIRIRQISLIDPEKINTQEKITVFNGEEDIDINTLPTQEIVR